MKLGLRIERDGATIADMVLAPGEHGIGRAGDNAVVLPDRAVSSKHALVRVGAKSVELYDQESLNGVYVEGRKVGRVVIARDLTAEICGFRLHFHPMPDARRLPSLPLPGLRLAVLMILAILALGVLLAAWLPERTAAREARQREGLRRGVLLARFLAEQNISPLRDKHLDQVRVVPVSAEEGVLEAYVTDPYGKILAPPKDMGRVLDNPRALRALQDSGVSLWTDPSGQTILTCPIRDGETLLGLAFLAFDPERAIPALDPTTGLSSGLTVAVLLWILAAVAIWRLTMRPARRLAEDMGVALKSGTGVLGFKPPCREYAALAQAAERLLALVPAATPAEAPPRPAGDSRAAPRPAQPAQPATPSPAPDRKPEPVRPAAAPVPEPAAGDEAWCLLALDGYRLMDWSPGFAAHLAAPDLTPPVHLLTALADPALLSAVAEVVEDPDQNAARPVQGTTLTAAKRAGTQPGLVRVAVTETP